MQRTQELLLFSLPFLQSLSSILPILFCSPVSHNRCCCSLISRFLISTPTMKTSLALQSRYMENLLQRHCQAFFVYLLGFFYYVQSTSPEVWQWRSRLQSPKHAGPCSFSTATVFNLSLLQGSLHPVHKPGFTEAGPYVLMWNHMYFRTTEMDIGGLSTLLLMHTLGAVILCETVLLRIMDVTEL